MDIHSRLFLQYVLLLLITLSPGVTAACSGVVPSNSDISSAQYNPASDRISSLAGIPPESDTTGGGIIPNLTPIVDASLLAAANMEASNVKTAARTYLSNYTTTSIFTSDDLQPAYITGSLKAKYYLDSVSILITRVDTVPGSRSGMVFSLSRQKWIEGIADNDHPEDQDVP